MIAKKILWISLIVIQAAIILFYSILTAWSYRNFGTTYKEEYQGPYPYFSIICIILWVCASMYASIRHLKTVGKTQTATTYSNTGKEIASIRSRVLASLIDGLVLSPLVVIPYFIKSCSIHEFYLFTILTYFFFLYDMLFDWRTGQTIGKRILKIQVYQLTGEKLTFKNAVLRGTPYNLLALFVLFALILANEQIHGLNIAQKSYHELAHHIENWIPTLHLASVFSLAISTVDILSMCLRTDKRAFHDIFGRTIVLRNK